MSTDTGERFRNLVNPPAPKEDKVSENYKANLGTKLRTVLQGLSFGSSDEIEAFMRSIGSQNYEEALGAIRTDLKNFSETNPVQSAALEAGGAILPGVAAAPFTGGSSMAATIPRLMAVGAAAGGAYSFNTGEGGFKSRASRVPGGATAGAILNPAVSKATEGAAVILKELIRSTRNLVGRRGSNLVNNEIQRLIEKTGKTKDEVLQDIYDGKIIAENRTLRAAIKALRAKDGEASGIITETIAKRPAETREVATDALDGALGGNKQMQYAKQQATNKAVREAENKAYAPFKTGEVSEEFFAELKNALSAVPAVQKSLLKRFQTRVNDPNYEPLFEKGEKGVLKFLRRPTPEEAEMVRKALDSKTNKEFTRGDPFVGEGYQEVAGNLRKAIDVNIPELASVRGQAAAARNNKDAFQAGRTAFTGKADEKIFEVEELIARQDIDELNAYRSGFLSGIQAKLLTPQRSTVISKLADEESVEREILKMILPEEDLPSVLKKLEVAQESNLAKKQIIDNTNTAEAILESQSGGSQLGVGSLIQAKTGDPRVFGDIARALQKAFGRELSPSENARLAKLVTSTDVNYVKSAITDKGGLAYLQRYLSGGVDMAASGAPGAAINLGAGATADRTGSNLEQNLLGYFGR